MDAFSRGRAAHERGDHQAAIDNYTIALNDRFDDPQILYHLGAVYREAGLNGLAVNLLASASHLLEAKTYASPRNNELKLDVLNNIGIAYLRESNFDGAREIWEIARSKAQEYGDQKYAAQVLANVATAFTLEGEYARAIPLYEEALAVIPDSKDAQFNYSQAKLAIGRWAEGWDAYEIALTLGLRRARNYVNVPVWNGEKDKKIVVYGEQGLGDEILFASMIPDLMAVSKEVVLDCHPRLVDTFTRSFGIKCYGTRKQADAPWLEDEKPDYSIAIGSLGKFFRRKDEDFPGTPYLTADPEKVAKLRSGSEPGTFRVGVAWQGGTKKTGKKFRSASLDTFLPFFKKTRFQGKVEFFSLQYTPEAGKEVDEFEMRTGVHIKHFPSLVQCDNYDATVHFAASMDCIITVCQSIVHVAGALGVPCYVMVPKESAWRETGNSPERREQMPWYSSVKLFHRDGQDWGPVVEKIEERLTVDIRAFYDKKSEAWEQARASRKTAKKA